MGKRIINMLNKSLIPIAFAYKACRKIIWQLKEKVPLVYNEIEKLVRSNLVTFGKKDKVVLKEPDIEKFGNIIAENIVRKFPSVDEKTLQKFLRNRNPKLLVKFLENSVVITSEKGKDYSILGKSNMFKAVLIANRGEIALRILRACKELGIKAVVVYTKHDKEALAVKFADKSYYLGNSAMAYMDIKKIVSIAKKANVEAIHPGYGFLSENPSFARLCEKNKLVFIGPSPKTIETLGDKVKAKHYFKKAQVPVIEGSKVIKKVRHAIKLARKIGYPVILKAAAGGGGKGMRVVRNEKNLEKAFLTTQNEAKASFGDKSIYMEKYMDSPRHIEFQILSDKYGNIIHLGERECSIQRRHQKLIEEAPSTALDQELREKMGEAAVNAVSAVKYQGAGTVEFLLDKNKNFYFIEMNTRIQVEHAITEIITNVDLVKEQIKLAAGAELAYKQENIVFEGHAIECRINAEDPMNNFMPSPGTITNYLAPVGNGIRVSSICHTGYKVLPNFDSLLSLLVCYGNSREEALARMKVALEQYIIEGVQTTIPFHLTVLNNENFIKGKLSTSFIKNEKILDKIVKVKVSKKPISNSYDRIQIVTAAVNEYLRRKNKAYKQNPWIVTTRHESLNQEIEL